MNRNFPLEIDILFLMDKSLAGEIKEMSNQEWFENRQMLLTQNQGVLIVKRVDIVAGSIYEELTFPKNSRKAFAVLASANFIDKTKQPYSLDLSNIKSAKIKVDGDEIYFVESFID